MYVYIHTVSCVYKNQNDTYFISDFDNILTGSNGSLWCNHAYIYVVMYYSASDRAVVNVKAII